MFLEKPGAERALHDFPFFVDPEDFFLLIFLLIHFVADIILCPAHSTLLVPFPGDAPLYGRLPPGFAVRYLVPSTHFSLRGTPHRTGPFLRSAVRARLRAVSGWAVW